MDLRISAVYVTDRERKSHVANSLLAWESNRVPNPMTVFDRNVIIFYYSWRVEPISAKSPAFQTESMSATFRKVAGQSFALLCQAQAYPVPSIR